MAGIGLARMVETPANINIAYHLDMCSIKTKKATLKLRWKKSTLNKKSMRKEISY